MSASRALVEGLIDYAGLFPPAALTMRETVERFADYQRRSDAWALGRLVVPVARLTEFEAVRDSLSSDRRIASFPIAALGGPDLAQDRSTIAAFNARHAADGCAVRSLELRVASVAQIQAVSPASRELECYCELPLSAELPSLVAATRQIGARAKIRTGGVKAVDFPAPEAVLAFLAACAAERLPFKATAGLHHPVRGPAPLTYEPGSARATMYGYLNLILAATVLWHGRPEREAFELLRLPDRSLLTMTGERVIWAGIQLTAVEIATARQQFVLAVGSCSFTEPMDELVPLIQVGESPLATP